MDCKKALTETNGDMEAAVEYLRKSGMAKAEKRADKATKEGKIYAAVDGNKAVMIEVLCEDYDEKRGLYLGREPLGRMGYFSCDRDRIGEFVTIKVTKANGVSLYGEDLTELPQPSGDGDGTAPELVEDVPVTVPRGPFPVKNFIDGSTNWLEQLENNDIRLLGASRNPLWTVKFQTPLCGTVRQIDYLKNDKLQMLFASEDKIYLLDRLGRKVGRFPISLGKRILLGPDVYDFSGDRDYTLMVLHEDNTLMQYGLDGKPVPGWNVPEITSNPIRAPGAEDAFRFFM